MGVCDGMMWGRSATSKISQETGFKTINSVVQPNMGAVILVCFKHSVPVIA